MLHRCHKLISCAIEEIEIRPTADSRFVSQFIAASRARQQQKPDTGALTDEDVQRLSISTHSPESFFNKKKGITDPSWVVSEENEKLYSPTRFGDWEKNSRCMDF
ncbi:hypothetical protein XU18_1271 [Perkinsela sp. CCAP 1560/4]|nr:hypothetical protein XU18_1271 [Perkinsela sp. CCAP 1560/4]|eukprot:KNH08158.1 hypothetical protein XU18_1271 [Perkinsela sp. CCAP 1560/4]